MDVVGFRRQPDLLLLRLPSDLVDQRMPVGPASSSTPQGKGAGRGFPAAAALRASASAGPPFGRAPWEKAGYRHPSSLNVLIPDGKDRLHHNVNKTVRTTVRSGRAYDGKLMNKNYITDLEYAISKCIRHSKSLQMSPAGFCYLTDVGYIIWKDPARYYNISKYHRPTEAELMFAVEVSKPGRYQVSALSGDRKDFN